MAPLRATVLEDSKDEVQRCRQALELHPEGHPRRSWSLLDLAFALQERFDQDGRIEDLMETISLDREALELCPIDHPNHLASLDNLANALKARSQQRGQREDLDEAVMHHRNALSLRSKDDPFRSFSLGNLAHSLKTRFVQRGEQEDLDEAISLNRNALSLRPEGHPFRSSSLNDLATVLQIRFEQRGEQEDLDEAIAHHREALPLCPEGHLLRPSSLNSLANGLKARFEQRGEQEDLDEAIAHHRDALSLRPEGNPSRSSSLNNLATVLQIRFEQRGEQEDSDEAITHNREALSLCPDGHPLRSMSLNNLANGLKARYEQRGEQEDLDEAIAHHRGALSLRPEGNPFRSSSLNNLATVLQIRFEQRGEQEDSDEAITHNREALSLLSKGHPLRSISLNNLADALQTRYERRGDQKDLDEAVAHYREALSLCPEGNPLRALSLSNLATGLKTRFEQSGEQEDLYEAIAYHLDALSLRPNGHPDRSLSLYNLVITLMKMHESSSHADGRVKSTLRVPHSRDNAEIATSVVEPDYIIGLAESAVEHEISNLKDRLTASFIWIWAARQLRHGSISRAYSTALALLARISTQRSTLESQHESFSSTFYNIPKSFISDAASSAIETGMVDTAVEFLEQGRGILWSRMKGYRHPLLKLRETHPDLAKRYETLGSELERHATTSVDVSGGSSVLLEARWQEYQKLSDEWNKVVEEIRNVDGFQDFLKHPRFSDLRKAAESGPVILLNVSEYRSDAIILFDTIAPVLVPLPHFTPQALDNLLSQFLGATSSHSDQKLVGVLRNLWKMAVEPVVDYLKSHGVPIKSRIWWCPTSQLCALPIHAAGPYSPGNKNLPDLYVSSYTPTLSALISAREGLNIESAPIVPKLLVVGEPDGGSIPAVEEEVRRIQRLGPFVKVLSGEAVSCKSVVRALGTHSWIHFACHGILDPVPFHSSFKLHNGEYLELIELIKARLPEAELAFLSACHAAAVHLKGAPDEVIHLSAAMQFCGFRSVVGTLWAMADEDGPDVAEDFYRYMLRDLESGRVDFRDAATALNLATREMRRRRIPLDRWVNFVHIGA